MTIYYQHYCTYCSSAYNRTQEKITPGFCSRDCEISENNRRSQKSFIQQRLESLTSQRALYDRVDHSLGLPAEDAVPVPENATRKREYRCVCCGITDEYNNKPIKLQLYHVDGNDKNFVPENVCLLCPNCLSQEQ
jgi:hypothetical protein